MWHFGITHKFGDLIVQFAALEKVIKKAVWRECCQRLSCSKMPDFRNGLVVIYLKKNSNCITDRLNALSANKDDWLRTDPNINVFYASFATLPRNQVCSGLTSFSQKCIADCNFVRLIRYQGMKDNEGRECCVTF
jgi:hypothetical protein